MNLGAVVLAAGQGKRLKTACAKVLHLAHGRPLLAWVLDAVAAVGAQRTVVVVGHLRHQVEAFLAGQGVIPVLQDPPLGTGDAVRAALPALAGCTWVLVVPGDAPLLTATTLNRLSALAQQEEAACALLTACLAHPGGYGRVVRRHGEVVRIVEAKDASPEELALAEVNAGVYVFQRAALQEVLPRLGRHNVQEEYYLTDVVGLLAEGGCRVVAYPLEDPEEMLGVNTRAELAVVAKKLNARTLRRWQEEGVTILDPESTWIEVGVHIGADTVLEPGVHLRGNSELGEGCWIGAHSVLDDVRLPPRTRIPPLTYLKGGSPCAAS
ncbi:MAG: NTP transferase domain-containing protein [Thermoanaerobaculum sp.]|nr:NTP transferase domain-containing protein [Thermoanaerobaculum sp.]